MHRYLLLVVTVLLLALTGIFINNLSGSTTEEEQKLFRNDIERQGLVNRKLPEQVDLKWKIEGINKWTHTAAKSSPVLTRDGIVVGGDTGTVHHFSKLGKPKWASATEPSENGIHGTAAVKNGKVFIGAYDGAVYSYDLETGKKLWRTKLGDAIGSSPLLYDGKLYVSVETNEPSGIMAILDPEDGDLLWKDTRITDHPHSSVAVSPKAGVFTVGSNDGYLYSWKLGSQDFNGKFKTEGAIKGPIAVDGHTAVFGSWDEKVYSVNLSTMESEWTFSAEADVMSGASIGEKGTVYIGSHDTQFYALNGTTGEKVWEFDTAGWITGSPTLTENAVVFGSKDNHLYAVNRSDGSPIWSFEASGDVTSAPAITKDGKVIFTDRATDEEAGSMYVLG